MRVAKRSEADGAGNPSRLAKQPLAAWPLQVGGDPTLCGKGAGGFPLHPCHVANAGVGSAHGVGKTLGGRAVGDSKAVGTHFKGFGVKGARAPPYKAQWNLAEIALCSLAWLSGDRWAHVASVAKAAPCALRPLSLDNLQVLVQSLPVALS